MAVGHSILVIAWHLLTNDCDYTDLGGDYFVRRDGDRARQRAVAQLQASATRSPSNPSPHDGDSPFRMRPLVQVQPGPLYRGLTCANASPLSLAIAAARVRRLRTAD
jgi:hypothetical protein